MPARPVLHVVPHTHWDREWYEPFEGYRFRLVKMADRLLEVLDGDPDFRHFNFDGQTAAIEDYLDVRPDAEPAVARLVAAGRLALGPWRILMDEFLCSPETIVRNLRQGHATAQRLGGAMRLGYIPDSFGHIAQMPQLLRLAGLGDACVWRGVPRAIDRTVFRWEAPDGSSVRTLYLATSYSNGASLPASPEELLRRARRIAGDLEPFAPGAVLLALNGSDHRPPEDHLPETFAKANAMQDEIEFRLGSMEEYLAVAPDGPALPVWRGEMRSGARANLLMGVASARMPLKQAEFTASSVLERYAEPLAALSGADPGTLLGRAWRGMVENSAHDSICGCGIDAVADQVLARYVEAARIGELVAADGLETLERAVEVALPAGVEGVVAFNPSPRARGAVTQVTHTSPFGPERLAFRAPDGTMLPAQILATEEQVVVDMKLRGAQLAQIVPTVHSRLIGDLFVNEVSIERGKTTTVRMRLGPVAEGHFDVEAAKRSVEAVIERDPGARFRVIGLGPPVCRTLVVTGAIPGLGWSVLEPVEGPAAPERPARADGGILDNGILRVDVDAAGRASLLDRTTGARFEGLLGIEEGGDAGDEYNYSPPDHDVLVTEPAEPPVVSPVADGPLEATIRVTSRYRIPAGLSPDGRRRARRSTFLPVEMDLTLRAGEGFLRVVVRTYNDAADHRVRVRLPLPFRSDRSFADTAFHVTERALEGEGGVHELGLPTFPCRRWVAASDGSIGLAVLHRGTPEYELTDDGRTLAVTIMRCVGWLSRQGMSYRAGPAGPALAAPGAQLRGEHVTELAIVPHAGDWRTGDIHGAMESYAYPMRAVVTRAHPGPLPSPGGALELEPGSVQLSALGPTPAGVECRIYNASPEAVTARLRVNEPLPRSTARLVGLLGDERDALTVDGGTIELPMRAWEIATIILS